MGPKKMDDFSTFLKINSDGTGFGRVCVPSSELTVAIDASASCRYDCDLDIVDQNNGLKETVKTSCSRFNNDIMPEKVIFNGDTTVLINGDDKYVIKCGQGDSFDPVFGFLYGYFLMNNGMSKTQAGKFFKHLEKCAFEMPKKTDVKIDKVEGIIGDKSLTLDEYEKMMREVLEDYIV